MQDTAPQPDPRPATINIPRLISAYYAQQPDPDDPAQQVTFGTSGHRGTSLSGTFNENHILAICQAIAEHRQTEAITGPLYLGMDTHALSEPARITALEVFAAHGLTVMIADDLGYTPTPVISHAILTYNQGRANGLADGVVITPSHNPPGDGGFKYNPPSGGPADTDTTNGIQGRANALLRDKLSGVKRLTWAAALAAPTTHRHDYRTPYAADLGTVLDLSAVAASGLRIGVDPMGGAAVDYWPMIAERYGLDLTVVNPVVDPTFAFMPPDRDGKIRMDCSSPFAMARLLALKDKFDVAFGNDPDADRHGIVTPSTGLLNPNHFLAIAISYLFQNRPELAARSRRRQDIGVQRHDRPRRRPDSAGGWPKFPSASNGSWTVCWTGVTASAARKAPGPRSCAVTARSGPQTKTA